MMLFSSISCTLRLAPITALALAFQLRNASAQVTATPASSWLVNVKVTVPAGEIVHVTDTDGNITKAVLGSITSEAIEITVDGEARAVAAGHVQRIRWQQHDSWLTGAVIGAGIGAIPGLYYTMSDPNECAGLCPEEYALVGIGALVGGLVDWAITKKVTVYERATAGGAAGNVVVTPVLIGARRGVQMTVRF